MADAQNNTAAPSQPPVTAPVVPPAAPGISAPPTTEPPAPPVTPPAAAPVYTITLADGALLDKSGIDRLTEVAKTHQIAPEAAQAVAELMDKALQDAKATTEAQFQALRAAWVDQIKADAEMGQGQYDANMARVRNALDRYASPELRSALDTTGLGDHPELVRFLSKIGRAMSEDGEILRGGTPPPVNRTAAEIMYGTPPAAS